MIFALSAIAVVNDIIRQTFRNNLFPTFYIRVLSFSIYQTRVRELLRGNFYSFFYIAEAKYRNRLYWNIFAFRLYSEIIIIRLTGIGRYCFT